MDVYLCYLCTTCFSSRVSCPRPSLRISSPAAVAKLVLQHHLCRQQHQHRHRLRHRSWAKRLRWKCQEDSGRFSNTRFKWFKEMIYNAVDDIDDYIYIIIYIVN